MRFSEARHPGYTYLEILITVSIIAILVGIISASLNVTDRLNDASNRVRVESRRELRNALVQYNAAYEGQYPAGITGEEQPICRYGESGGCVNLDLLIQQGYLEDIPVDPLLVDSESPESGYTVWIDEEGNVVVEAVFAQLLIESSVPLIHVETASLEEEIQVKSPTPDIREAVGIPFPLITDIAENGDPAEPPDLLANFVLSNPSVANATTDQTAVISVTQTGATNCSVMPPFSALTCGFPTFSFQTGDIAVSADFRIESRELGLSNILSAQHLALRSTTSVVPKSNMSFVNYKGYVYFVAWASSIFPPELFRTDGQTVTKVSQGLTEPQGLTVSDGQLYFSARNADGDNKLFVTDGNGIRQVSDLSPSQGDSIEIIGEHNGQLYFYAFYERQSGGVDKGLFRLEQGKIVLIQENIEKITMIDATGHTKYPHDLWLTAKIDGGGSFQLYRLTENQLIEVIDSLPDPAVNPPSAFGGFIYFTKNFTRYRTDGDEIYQLNGTINQYQTGISGQICGAFETQSVIAEPTMIGDRLYFVSDNSNCEQKVFVSDGVSIRQVSDINPAGSDDPRDPVVLDGNLYFSARNGAGSSRKLFKIHDGFAAQVSNTNPGGSDDPRNLTVIDDRLYFLTVISGGNDALAVLTVE